MPTPEELLETGMLITISIVLVLFLLLLLAKIRQGSRIRGDFALLFLAFMVGWLAAEILAVLSPPSLELVAESLHLAVILFFAVFLALRWRWAMRMALQEGQD